MDNIWNYIQDHIALTVVLAVVLVLIIVVFVLLVVEISRKKHKTTSAEQAATDPEVKDSMPPEKPIEEIPAAPAAETPQPPQEPQKDELAGFVFVPVKKEKKTAAEEAALEDPMKQEKKTDKKPAPTPVAAKKPAAKPAKKETVGKWIIYEEDRGGFGFKLVASNGEEMIKSSSPYASLSSAKSGIKTYQDNIAAGRLEVVETKKGNFFVQVNNASKRLLATSADYKTRTSCENAMESIKRWASTTVIAVEGSDDGEKK